MKFDSRAIQILRNFTSINPGILFRPGNEIRTISTTRSIMARATISTKIEAQFAIYDLSQFLSAVSLFDSPDLVTKERSVVIESGAEKLEYFFTAPDNIMAAPDKEVAVQDAVVNFTMKADVFARLQKAISVISVPEIAITGEDGKIYLEGFNSKDSGKSFYRVEVGETDKSFRFIFSVDNVKLLAGDYEVSATSKGIGHFKGSDVEYWIAMESSSSYNG